MFGGNAEFKPSMEDGKYCLVGEKVTYYRVGELDYEIDLNDPTDESGKDILNNAEKYELGSVISAEGFELVFDEAGIASDIRISSNSSGIKITSGPSVVDGKRYVYLKGTLKNTGKTAIREAIGGTAYLDDYEFALDSKIISTTGNPASSVDPLDTVYILIYAQISDEMAEQFSLGKVVLGFNDNFADVQVDKAQYLYYVEITK